MTENTETISNIKKPKTQVSTPTILLMLSIFKLLMISTNKQLVKHTLCLHSAFLLRCSARLAIPHKEAVTRITQAGAVRTACGFSVVVGSAVATSPVSERKLSGAKARAEQVREACKRD